jgi:hypothetical protein
MSASPRRNDPRVPEILKHLRILARRHNRRLVVQDYLEYRAKYAPHLPALTTVYRLLGSWPEALAAAGVEQAEKTELSRTSDEALIAALKEAAEALDVKVLSSHAYDEYRKTQAPHLPSSSVIRKWLGRWAQAVKLAGLETTERSTPRRPTMAEIIDALRQAKSEVPGMLTLRAYSEYHAALPQEEKDMFPDVTHILSQFPNWDSALRAADVEQSDALHPEGLWTAEEARRIAQQVERLTGRQLDEEGYAKVHQKATKPMPSWRVLQELLSS